ncbi:MAG: hypothetical protein ABSA58_02415 [Acetobacteraceae bacterium]|jgi:hypothetical protein
MTFGRRSLLGLAAAVVPIAAGGAAAAGFEAVLHDGDRERTIGRVAIGSRGMLTVLFATRDRAAWLRDIAHRTNALPAMSVDTPPPANAPPYTDASRIVPRDSPDFPKALRDYLMASYRLELRPARG